ncbi:PREDICTED: uncharacterized protein LOC108774101 [Cyphomyrmex costatus]|uniref:uncharacterized protein LOC108774101 n=1 Tax=Cyphomyrmex costatus TaxID=456900 RepID=UPI0008523395|nr:PREDICTED: uncharacterized protein LOC108774101 [Cyphomyrmex costatus]
MHSREIDNHSEYHSIFEIEIMEDTDDEASKQIFEEHYFEYLARVQSLLDNHLRNSVPNNVIDSIARTTSNMSMNSAQPVQKFNYLKSCLLDSAAQIIHSLASTDENYEIAWRLLSERFNNKRIIIQNHVRALFELSAVTKETTSSLNSLIDTAQKHIQSLKALGQPTDQWNGLLLHLITSKLDKVTYREWEKSLDGTELPNINDLWKFLRNKCHVLQAVASETSNSSKGTNKTRQVLLEAQSQSKCCICSKNHNIVFCDSFKQLDHSKRVDVVKKADLCFNCLRSNHQISSCNAGNCKKCNKRHNTLLHPSKTQTNDTDIKDNVNQNSSEQTVQQSHTTSQILSSRFKGSSQVILSTAMIDIKDSEGNFHTCKAMLDTGSQSNFISSIGNSLSHIKHLTNTIIRSRSNAFSLDLRLLVISNITTWLPSQTIDHSKLGIPDNVQFADPEFYKPAPETEELPAKKLLSPEEEQCEAHFMNTFKREENGRISVGLPFNSENNSLGDSFNNATRRFYSLEKRLIADPHLYEAYREFLQDYESLNHMTEVSQADNNGCYYIPHHVVLKSSSLTTKLRVVFDASAKTTTGLSLNDTLLTGPVVQNELFDIIMRFRTHKVVFTADVQQMYRQFLINKEDRPFQRILWRNNQDEHYVLLSSTPLLMALRQRHF